MNVKTATIPRRPATECGPSLNFSSPPMWRVRLPTPWCYTRSEEAAVGLFIATLNTIFLGCRKSRRPFAFGSGQSGFNGHCGTQGTAYTVEHFRDFDHVFGIGVRCSRFGFADGESSEQRFALSCGLQAACRDNSRLFSSPALPAYIEARFGSLFCRFVLQEILPRDIFG